MASGKIRTAAAVLLIWTSVVAFVMIYTRTLNIEIFFVLWLIAALVITEFLSPQTMNPKWKLMQMIVLGIAVSIFAVIVVMKIIAILSTYT